MSPEIIEKAFEGTSYGDNPNYNLILLRGLLKLSIGFDVGKTTKSICKELGLLNKSDKPNSNGLKFMRDNYHLILNKPS